MRVFLHNKEKGVKLNMVKAGKEGLSSGSLDTSRNAPEAFIYFIDPSVKKYLIFFSILYALIFFHRVMSARNRRQGVRYHLLHNIAPSALQQ